MSAINPPFATGLPLRHDEPSPPGDNYLTHGRGILSWILTLDHKRIAIMYLVTISIGLFLGGVFAMMVRTELLTPGPTFTFGVDPKVDPIGAQNVAQNFYNHMFTLHGAVMIFLFVIPGIPAIMGNFVLPIMLGAKDVAFPRLNLFSYHLFVIGMCFFLYVLLSGVIFAATGHSLPGGFGLDTGWTFYTPYSTSRSAGGVVPAVLGAFILGFSSILTGVNFIASMHTLRPKGMHWFRMPLFLWSLYATSIIQILATPVLGITLLLIAAEKILRIGIFDPAIGGDPVLMQHFFWFYSHPAVYIMILPAMGIISELISTYSHKHIFGYNFIALSSIAIALLSFMVWGHHMFVSGQSPLANAIFSLLTFSVSIPSAIKVFNWLATLYKGQIRLKTGMMYALAFILLFTIGGLTGLFLGALATDIHLTDTYFIVAHFHFVMVGSVLIAFLGGLYHWWPKMTGKMYSDFWGNVFAVIVFIGFNVTFLPQFVAGTHGMPRRYASYPVQFQIFHVISTIGAYIMMFGMIGVLLNLLHSLFRGAKAPANPWGANTLEWHTASPPPHDNFKVQPAVSDPYYLDDWKYDAASDSWVMTDTPRPVRTAAH